MMDREKVIKGLECCDGYCDDETGCPYFGVFEPFDCEKQLRADTIALLKAQEPNEDWISRKRLKDEIQYYIDEAGWGDEANKVLGWCMEFIDNQRAVKWE